MCSDSSNMAIFKDIAPYDKSIFKAALRRLMSDENFKTIASFVFPNISYNALCQNLKALETSDEFQVYFMHRAVRRVIEESATTLTYEGFENLSAAESYLFIANHRDIVLDSAIMQALLVEHDMDTTEISLGDNLMISDFIIDFAKINKMYTVYRGGSRSAMLNNSKNLSAYIRFTIKEKKTSVWIAQRNGRTKDGNDRTEEALLKMLNLSGLFHPADNLTDLNIVPLTISYEYEPCGKEKVKELYKRLQGPYEKTAGEDLKSILSGILNFKGRIHLSVGNKIDFHKEGIMQEHCYSKQIQKAASAIDRSVHQNYKLWPNNFIAYDMLNNQTKFNDRYSQSDYMKFKSFISEDLAQLNEATNVLRNMYLEMYALPVLNKIRYNFL